MMDHDSEGHLFVTTFYSYKGGVGRSVALLNAAHQLASRGRKVALIDFDLEAPGLHSAVESAWPYPDEKPSALPPEGILEYFQAFRRSGGQIPPLDDYLSTGFGPSRLIHLIRAGSLDDFERYTSDLAQISFEVFARAEYGRELLLELRDELRSRGFDYLLIDSRTGHTDFTGATTVLLPHLVVLFTNLSEQSLEGTAGTRKWIRKNGEPGKSTPADSVLLVREPRDPQIETLVVASPVPFGDQSGIARAEEMLRAPVDHLVYYIPRIAAHESEHVIRAPSPTATRKTIETDPAFQMYSVLADRIEAFNPYEPRSLAERGIESLSRQDWRVALGYLRAAESFLRGTEDARESVADTLLQVRLWLGKARALALGFQTSPAKALIGKARAQIAELAGEKVQTSDLNAELIVASMQLVRGLYGANRLSEAAEPARAAEEVAALLEDRSARDHWRLTTGLVAADAMMLGGDYDGAVKAAAALPDQARRLNRAAEMLSARQIRINALLSNGLVRAAEQAGRTAVEEAEAFGVDYLVAETHYVMAVVEMAAGKTTDEGVERLQQAEAIYEQVGDGFGLSNCRCEMGLYLHRRGAGADEIRPVLTQAVEGYQKISGSALGEITGLVYATRMLIDRCVIDGPSADRPPLTAALIVSDLPRAADTLYLAAGIARDNEITLLDDLISAYRTELALFADTPWLEYVERELYSDHRPRFGETEENPANVLEARRSRLLAGLVRGDPDDGDGADRILDLCAEAQRRGARYDEACTVALAALALEATGDEQGRNAQIARLAELHREHPLAWPVWGQVRAVRDHLRLSEADEWRRAAASLLARAADDPSLPPVPPHS